jgi:SAM-dependent methyltransferase
VTSDYRRRLYADYVSGGQAGPATLEGLRSREAPLEDIIARHFPPDRDATGIDLGCGHGAVLYFAQRAGYRNLVGVDASAEQVAAAAALGVRGVSQGDLLPTLERLPDASQDLVLAIDVLEHLGKAELFPFVDAVLRVLRPGGRFLLKVPNGESPLFGRVRYGDLTHELAFTRESLPALLHAAGFREVRCHEYAPVPRGARGSARWLAWRLIRGALRLYLAAESGDRGRDAIFTQTLLAVAFK